MSSTPPAWCLRGVLPTHDVAFTNGGCAPLPTDSGFLSPHPIPDLTHSELIRIPTSRLGDAPRGVDPRGRWDSPTPQTTRMTGSSPPPRDAFDEERGWVAFIKGDPTNAVENPNHRSKVPRLCRMKHRSCSRTRWPSDSAAGLLQDSGGP